MSVTFITGPAYMRDPTQQNEVLRKLVEQGVCEDIQESWYYVDEPTHYQFHTRILAGTDLQQTITCSGLAPDRAYRKALYEAVERYCLSQPLRVRLTTLEELAASFPLERMPRVRADLSAEQIVRVVDDVETLTDSEREATLLPAQLVSVPYQISDGEVTLREPISTGAACGDTRDEAILRGLLECIERDALMLSFYTRRCVARVDVRTHEELAPVVEELQRCRLELILADISTPDFSAITFLALLVDETGFGPAVTAGAKCGFHAPSVAVGAIEEAIQLRGWLRDQLATEDGSFDQAEIRNASSVHTFLDRARVWSPRSMLRHLQFYGAAAVRSVSVVAAGGQPSTRECLDTLTKDLRRLTAPAYVVDLSSRFQWAKELSLHVVKVIAPTLQPLFIDESLRVLSGGRLEAFQPVADAPTHFFL